ncbi:MAG: DUF362 domain-containing protein [Candidatus Ranarchaeia archaeon]
MTASKVWFVDRNVKIRYSMLHKLKLLWENTPLGQLIEEGQNVAIKTHFGAEGNTNYVRPVYVRTLVDLIRAKGAYPVVFETCGLGYGRTGIYAGRSTAPLYIEKAASHGYTNETVGAPILMVDGYWGTDVFWQDIDGKYFDKVAIGMALRDFDWIIMFTHFKGHPIAGIGGALKNLAIGCVGKYSKARMHTTGVLTIDPDKCLGENCSQPCTRVCPFRCIVVKPKDQGGSGIAEIDQQLCTGCQQCQSACRILGPNAISSAWLEPAEQVERMIDNVKGVLKGIGKDRFIYLNLLIDIGEQCDCVPFGPIPLVPDLGMMVSRDPVAIDKASYDLVTKQSPIQGSAAEKAEPGMDKFAYALAKKDEKTGELVLNESQTYQLQLASQAKLGSLEYVLEPIDAPPKDD